MSLFTKSASATLPSPRTAPSARPYRVVSVMHRKGGVGKTRTTAFLGQQLAQEGRAVELVDADRSTQSLYRWASDLRRDYPEYELPWRVYQYSPRDGLLVDALDEQHERFGPRLFIVDNGAEDSTQLQAAAGVSDLIVVPCGTHQDEVRNLADVYQDAMRGCRPGTPIRVLLTRVERPGMGSAAEVRRVLVQMGYQVLENEIPRKAQTYGRFGAPIEDTGAYADVAAELGELVDL